MDMLELYKKYVETYKTELTKCDIPQQIELLKTEDLLENLTIDEFKERLENDSKFKDKYGFKSNI
jgi:hypothetical protein